MKYVWKIRKVFKYGILNSLKEAEMAELREGDYIRRMADYVERNLKKRYTLDQLENALMKQGHSRVAVRRAIMIATEKLPKTEIPTEPLPQTQVITGEEEKEREPLKVVPGLAYVLGAISGIIVLLNAKKDDKFMRFHALQSIFFTLFSGLIFGIIAGIIAIIVSFGGSSWGKWASTFYLIYWIIFEIIMLAKMFETMSGKKKRLPVIGHLSENLS